MGLSISLTMQLCNSYNPALDFPPGFLVFHLGSAMTINNYLQFVLLLVLPIHWGAHQKWPGDLTVFPVPFVATGTVSQTFDLQLLCSPMMSPVIL